MSNLPEFQYVSPELIHDPYHPENTQFFAQNRRLQHRLVAAQSQCIPKHVEIAKLHVLGKSNVDIASKLEYAPQTVGNALRRTEVRELTSLLHHYSNFLDGPSIEVRKRELWEMYVDNKVNEPRAALAAMTELNRMDGIGKDKPDQKITLIINDSELPRTVLDEA